MPIHKCGVNGCKYKFKCASHLEAHELFYIHEGDHHCDVSGCTYKTKDNDLLRQHKANVHYICDEYYLCDVPGCKYQTKWGLSTLKSHKMSKHKIGV